MLRFCSSCRTITDERDMHTDDICICCWNTEAENAEKERRMIKRIEREEKKTLEASAEPAGEVESGPYLPGFAPDQGK